MLVFIDTAIINTNDFLQLLFLSSLLLIIFNFLGVMLFINYCYHFCNYLLFLFFIISISVITCYQPDDDDDDDY